MDRRAQPWTARRRLPHQPQPPSSARREGRAHEQGPGPGRRSEPVRCAQPAGEASGSGSRLWSLWHGSTVRGPRSRASQNPVSMHLAGPSPFLKFRFLSWGHRYKCTQSKCGTLLSGSRTPTRGRRFFLRRAGNPAAFLSATRPGVGRRWPTATGCRWVLPTAAFLPQQQSGPRSLHVRHLAPRGELATAAPQDPGRDTGR